ncbi:MAG: hypothetical protein ACTSSP_00135 [Candidatus Asgardarchaeia archaeon]
MPSFSFSGMDPNNLQIDYAVRMEKYDEILSSSPIPVFVMSMNEFAFDFLYYFLDDPNSIGLKVSSVEDINILGMYVINHGVKGWPNEFIFINEALAPRQIMVVYAHEIGHYNCQKIHCKCLNPHDLVLSELHGLLNELQVAWDHDLPIVMESSIRIMASQIIDPDTDLHNKIAIALIMDFEIWEKSIKYLKDQEEIINKIR